MRRQACDHEAGVASFLNGKSDVIAQWLGGITSASTDQASTLSIFRSSRTVPARRAEQKATDLFSEIEYLQKDLSPFIGNCAAARL